MPIFFLNPEDKAPLYQQIAQGLEEAIAQGRLCPGDKLPTVRELSQELNAAGGTVKRAYEELCRRGLLEMTQGKGTFVARPAAADSRKEQAMSAIDAMLDRMEALSFSPREIQIFLDLKLRQRQRDNKLRLAVVDSSPERLRMLADRLYGFPNWAVYPLPLEEALEDPGQLSGEMDLAVTIREHFNQLTPQLKGRLPLAALCLRPSEASLLALARLPQGLRLGILAQSQAFFQQSRELCLRCCPEGAVRGIFLPKAEDLCWCEALVAPACFEQLCPPEVLERVSAFGRSHPLVRLELEPDQGSLDALEVLLHRASYSRR